MSEQRDRQEILQVITGLDRSAAQIPDDPFLAGGMKMAADFLRWSIFQQPKHGIQSIPMMIMNAKAVALIGTDE
jgi:hypothetical protein